MEALPPSCTVLSRHSLAYWPSMPPLRKWLLCKSHLNRTGFPAQSMHRYPVAGGQYFWTFHFAPPKVRIFLSYFQGSCHCDTLESQASRALIPFRLVNVNCMASRLCQYYIVPCRTDWSPNRTEPRGICPKRVAYILTHDNVLINWLCNSYLGQEDSSYDASSIGSTTYIVLRHSNSCTACHEQEGEF